MLFEERLRAHFFYRYECIVRVRLQIIVHDSCLRRCVRLTIIELSIGTSSDLCWVHSDSLIARLLLLRSSEQIGNMVHALGPMMARNHFIVSRLYELVLLLAEVVLVLVLMEFDLVFYVYLMTENCIIFFHVYLCQSFESIAKTVCCRAEAILDMICATIARIDMVRLNRLQILLLLLASGDLRLSIFMELILSGVDVCWWGKKVLLVLVLILNFFAIFVAVVAIVLLGLAHTKKIATESITFWLIILTEILKKYFK